MLPQKQQEMPGQSSQQSGSSMQQPDQNEAAANAKRQAEQQELMKNSILTQVLDKTAQARLSNLLVAKPEKGKMVENFIIQLARTGQIRGRMTDEGLRSLLDQLANKMAPKSTKVKYDRRRAAIDSDEEEEPAATRRKNDEEDDSSDDD